MLALFEEYLNILQSCHDDILKTIEGLPPAALDWIPGQETNSISVLVYHTTGSERYWIGDVAMQESSNRDRDAEFKVRDVGVETLKQRLDASLAYARTALEKLAFEDLDKPCAASGARGDRTVTVAYALLHTIEHASEHKGHIQITSQLWKQANS